MTKSRRFEEVVYLDGKIMTLWTIQSRMDSRHVDYAAGVSIDCWSLLLFQSNVTDMNSVH